MSRNLHYFTQSVSVMGRIEEPELEGLPHHEGDMHVMDRGIASTRWRTTIGSTTRIMGTDGGRASHCSSTSSSEESATSRMQLA